MIPEAREARQLAEMTWEEARDLDRARTVALLPVGEAGLVKGPFVDITAGAEQARRVMEEHEVDWVGLLDGERLLGWVDRAAIDSAPLDEVEPRPFLVTLSSDSTLREALDAVVTSHARVAVVADDGVFKGMLDLESIAEGITE